MSNFTIGDDLRGVLVDVAKSDKQRLFAGNYFKNLHTEFAGKPEVVGIATPGLSSAERELVTLHRRELSMCLLQGFYAQVATGNVGINALAPTEPSQASNTWSEAAKFARDFAPAEAIRPGALHWLHRLLENERLETHEEFLSLAAAARRLVDSPSGTLYQGLSHYMFGRLNAAQACLSELGTHAPSQLRILALRVSQAVRFQQADWTGVIDISETIVGLTSKIGLDDEMVNELWRLCTTRAMCPAVRRIPLPPKFLARALVIANSQSGADPASPIIVEAQESGILEASTMQLDLSEILSTCMP